MPRKDKGYKIKVYEDDGSFDRLFDECMEEIARGRDLTEICKSKQAEKEWPSVTTFRTWIREREDCRKKYIVAKHLQADHDFEQTSGIYQQLIQGEMKPDVAKIALDILKWRTSRLEPRKYHDKYMCQEDGGEKTSLTIRIPELEQLRAEKDKAG